MIIPRSHPRYKSLKTRENLVMGSKFGIVVPEGLIAHGRGEAFDYILGEKTRPAAHRAIRAAAALLLMGKNPIISVNGNTAALVPAGLVKLATTISGNLEVNLFHRGIDRERKISRVLRRTGAREVLGVGPASSARIPGLKSDRRKVDPSGIAKADVILVPLEDGDRATFLRRMGKKVIAIDLNPLSRTSQSAYVTIVDNVTRAVPLLSIEVKRLKGRSPSELSKIIREFDNKKNLAMTIQEIKNYLDRWNGI